VYQATLAASLLTILANAALMRVAPRWLERLRLGPPRTTEHAAGTARDPRHVVICGFGRVGSAIGEALDSFRVPYVAVESDPDVVKGLRARGVDCVFGDAAALDVLAAAGTPEAAQVIVAVPDIDVADAAVRHARSLNPDARILARAHQPAGPERLTAAGATEIIEPEFEAASTLIRHMLRGLDLPRDRILAYLDLLRRAFDPTVPVALAAGESLPGLKEVAVSTGHLADQSLRDSRIRERFGVTIVALTRADGTAILHPSADVVLRAGDRVLVFGLGDKISAFESTAHEAA
jgi:CPA2 family monovalent cation:H+ antiporter-2